MSNFKIVGGMILEVFYCNVAKALVEREVRVKLLDGSIVPLSLDALRKGVRTEQCSKYGHSHEVISAEKPCEVCVPTFDVKQTLVEAGISFEYVAREYEVKYVGGSMRDGYGGAETTAHHKFGSLRMLNLEPEENGWDCGRGGHRYMSEQDEHCCSCGEWVGAVEA